MSSKESQSKWFSLLVKGAITEDEYENSLQIDYMDVGSRVEATHNYEGEIKGFKGTIVELVRSRTTIRGNQRVAVEFDEPFVGGHDYNGKAKNKHGWYALLKYLKPIDEESEAN